MPAYQTDETGMAEQQGVVIQDLAVRAKAEAQAYSLLNPYLSDYQKVIIETWYHLPIDGFIYSYILFKALEVVTTKPVILAIIVSLVIGWLTTITTNESVYKTLIPIYVLIKNTFVQLAVIAITAATGTITWGSAVALVVLAFTGLANPGRQLADTWAGHIDPRVHPKYVAAKVILNNKPTLAFENYLSQAEIDIKMSKAYADGRKMISCIMFAILLAVVFVWK